MTPRLNAFAASTSGNVAAIVALLTPLLIFIMGSVVNLSTAQSAHSRLQSAADSAALAAARELYMANSRPEVLKSVAYSFAMTNLGNQAEGVSIDVKIGGRSDATAAESAISTEVTVTLNKDFGKSLPMPDLTGVIGELTASATARIAGGGRICAIALTKEGKKAIDISGNARSRQPIARSIPTRSIPAACRSPRSRSFRANSPAPPAAMTGSSRTTNPCR